MVICFVCSEHFIFSLFGDRNQVTSKIFKINLLPTKDQNPQKRQTDFFVLYLLATEIHFIKSKSNIV